MAYLAPLNHGIPVWQNLSLSVFVSLDENPPFEQRSGAGPRKPQ
jgi:hypothetical protein